MKKTLLATVTVTMLSLLLSFAVLGAQPVEVFVGGEYIESDVEPIIVEDRILLPVRAVFEAIGAEVDYVDDGMQSVLVCGFLFLQAGCFILQFHDFLMHLCHDVNAGFQRLLGVHAGLGQQQLRHLANAEAQALVGAGHGFKQQPGIGNEFFIHAHVYAVRAQEEMADAQLAGHAA